MRVSSKFFRVFSLFLGSLIGACAQSKVWPTIQPAHQAQTFVNLGQDDTDTPFLLLIDNSAGAPAYKLECHNGEYEDTSEITFSGDYQCALFALDGNGAIASGNLLATNESAQQQSDWFNRGRMTSNQLLGKCGAAPEYGSVRHFSLRGMAITFQYANIKWSTSKIGPHGPIVSRAPILQFTFTVSAVADSSALTATADVPQASALPGCN